MMNNSQEFEDLLEGLEESADVQAKQARLDDPFCGSTWYVKKEGLQYFLLDKLIYSKFREKVRVGDFSVDVSGIIRRAEEIHRGSEGNDIRWTTVEEQFITTKLRGITDKLLFDNNM